MVQAADLTANNWNVSANIIGSGTIRVLRVSAFSLDFTPLDGSGTLFNLIMRRVSNTPDEPSPLAWAPAPDAFFLIDDQLNQVTPSQTTV